MKRMLLTTAAVFAVMCTLNISAANAAEYRSKAAGPADWADYTSWQIKDPNWRDAAEGEVPDTDDFVTIQTGHEIDVATEDANQAADYMDVYGTLDIETGRTLTVDGTASTTTRVDGTINLATSTSILKFTTNNTNNHTLSYMSSVGKIRGANSAAKIEIDGVSLTSSITIEGALVIDDGASNGSFVNQGTLDANVASGTLKVAIAGTFADSATHADRYLVSNSGSVLHFDSSIGTISELNGNFVMTNANCDPNSVMLIEHSLTTNGRLEQSKGKVTIGPAASATSVTMGSEGITSYHADISGTAVIQVLSGNTFEHE